MLGAHHGLLGTSLTRRPRGRTLGVRDDMKQWPRILLAVLVQGAVICTLGLGLFFILSCFTWFPWFEQDTYGPMSGLMHIASPLAGLSGLVALVFLRRLKISPAIPAAGLLPYMFVAGMYHASRVLNRFPPADFPAESSLLVVFAAGVIVAFIFMFRFMIDCLVKKDKTPNQAGGG
jgi:hypothetical protein